jgi:hypothetical protein
MALAPALARDLPQQILMGLQWLVLLAGIVALVFGPPHERRFPRRARGWVLTILVIVRLVLCGKVPADRPPAPDDCAIYTFWTSPSSTYGCQ